MTESMTEELAKRGLTVVKDSDTFNFRCTCCGACCRNREDILLNAFDITRIQKYLSISFEELLKKYLELYIGSESRLPIIRIRPMGQNRICPFLLKGKCRIHEVKPTVCALFPLGRVSARNDKTGLEETIYCLQKITCGASDKSNQVGEWVRNSISEDSISFGRSWAELIGKMAEWLANTKVELRPEIYFYLAQLMYFSYDPDRNMEEQVTERIKAFVQFAEMLDKEAARVAANSTGEK